MTGPAAPRGWPRSVAAEVRSERDQFAQRLRELGADPDEIAAAVERWDDLDDDWTEARRSFLAGPAGDNELRAMLAEVRAEYEVGTVTADDHDAMAATRARAVAITEAEGRIGGTVPALLAWVGDDWVRARAVLDLETNYGNRDDGRKTLIAALQEIIGAG